MQLLNNVIIKDAVIKRCYYLKMQLIKMYLLKDAVINRCY